MVHTYEMNGYRIALDVNSGSVHLLDETTYALIPYTSEQMGAELPAEALSVLGERFPEAALREAWDELYALFQGGALHAKDTFEPYKNATQNAPIKSMCLNIAHDCNLRCSYCFASTGDFGGGRKLMPFAVGKRAIDFLIAQSGTRRNLEVDFFGGEPLMNFEVVRQIVAYARSIEAQHNKHFRFTITTNGLLLDDDKIDFINKEMNNVVLSLDGRREVNDRMRTRVDGSGCYDAIVPKFQRLCERRGWKDYYARGTYTRENLDFSQDVLHIVGLGFDQVSVEPVIADEHSPMGIREEDLPRIFAEYDALSEELLRRKREGRGFNFFHFMIDLEHGPCAVRLLRGCGCGNEYVAVTPEGDIYPCHQFVGRGEWKMGNVLDEPVALNTEIKRQFADAHIYSKPKCRECWARFFCSGGCNANNSSYRGSILEPVPLTCAMEQKRLECAIYIKAALAGGEEPV